MAVRWCSDCGKTVETEKTSYIPGLAFVISALFYTIVPFFGTIFGMPALVICGIWFYFTKSVCSECKGSNMCKLAEKPSEYQSISEKYENKKDSD